MHLLPSGMKSESTHRMFPGFFVRTAMPAVPKDESFFAIADTMHGQSASDGAYSLHADAMSG